MGKSESGKRMARGVRAVAAVAAALAALACGPAAAQNTHLKVGQLTSLTGSAAGLGLAANIGARMAVKEINDRGGIMGRPIDLVVGDDQSDPTAAVNEARRLLESEKVEVLIGPQLSNLALATLPLTTKAKVLQFTSAGTLALSPDKGPYHFATLINSATQGISVVDFAANTLKVKSVAFLVDNTAGSRDVLEFAQKRAAEVGLKVTATEVYDFGAADMTPQLLNLRRSNPELVLFNTNSPKDLATMLRNRGEIGWNVPVNTGLAGATFGPNAVQAVGAGAFGGVTGTAETGMTYCTDPVGQSPYAKYVERLKAFAPESAGKYSPNSASYTYDAVYVLKAAVEGAKSFDAAKVAEWLEANASKVTGLGGPLSAGKATHHLVGPNAVVGVERTFEVRSDGLQKRAGC
jgi:branched-chain amino acid transport system substrate-binding protein